VNKEGFPCDRCGDWIDGMHTDGDDEVPGMTSGYYMVGEGRAWYEYRMSPDEERVCDDCIHSMPLYQRRYGPALTCALDQAAANISRRQGGSV
jgi:hypothetical protein